MSLEDLGVVKMRTPPFFLMTLVGVVVQATPPSDSTQPSKFSLTVTFQLPMEVFTMVKSVWQTVREKVCAVSGLGLLLLRCGSH